MQKTEKVDSKPGSDSLSHYLSDMSAFKVLNGVQEIEAVRKIEELEGDFVKYMLSNRGFCRNALHRLEKILKSSKENTKDANAIILSVSGSSPSKKAMYNFIRFIRFSDAGRQWMHLSYISAQDPIQSSSRQAWIKILKQKFVLQANAKNNFILVNLRLVIAIAKHYAKVSSALSISDLIQEGNIGLMRSVERFDVERGFKFSTYAIWWIKHHVRRSLENKGLSIRIPTHLSGKGYKIGRIEAKYYAKHGESIPVEILAEESQIAVKKVKAILATRGRNVLSLDAPIGSTQGDSSFIDILQDSESDSPLDTYASKKRNGDVRNILSCLNEREADIIRLRFGLDDGEELTLKEVGDKFNLSRERIRQIEFNALKKLRSMSVAQEWRPGSD